MNEEMRQLAGHINPQKQSSSQSISTSVNQLLSIPF